MKVIDPFLVALQFLTRLPVSLRETPTPQRIGQSLAFYPAVGLVIGLVLGAFHYALGDISALLRAAMLLVAWIALTGALHLDGLADSADAWAGGLGNHERALAIMKDPHIGPTAVVTLVLTLITKFAALTVLATDAWVILVLAPMLARSAVSLLFITTPYVRSGGLGESLSKNRSRYANCLAIGLTWTATLALATWLGLMLLLTLVITFLLARKTMCKHIGGTTGDTAGALIEISEIAILFTAVLLAPVYVALP